MNAKNNFTTIYHSLRAALDLNYVEYFLLDSLFHLINNDKNKTPGCYSGSKRYLAQFLQISETSVFNTIKKLKNKSLIFKVEEGRHLRVSEIWNKLMKFLETKPTVDELRAMCFEYTRGQVTGLNKVETKSKDDLDPIYKDNIKTNNIANNNSPHLRSGVDEKSEKENGSEKSKLKKVDPEKLNNFGKTDKKTENAQVGLLTKFETRIYNFYKENVFRSITKKTPTIVSGIPRLVRIFKAEFSEDELEGKIKEAIRRVLNSDWYKDKLREKNGTGGYIAAPKVFLSDKFIRETILPTVYQFNQNKNGRVCQTTLSPEELRQRQEANERKLRRILEHTPKG